MPEAPGAGLAPALGERLAGRDEVASAAARLQPLGGGDGEAGRTEKRPRTALPEPVGPSPDVGMKVFEDRTNPFRCRLGLYRC